MASNILKWLLILILLTLIYIAFQLTEINNGINWIRTHTGYF